MCGIAGVIDLNLRETVTESTIVRMCDCIRHRGPDDSGIFIDRSLGMGMRRLAIIDVTDGKQPIANEDQSVWVVFNGEIYNHQKLRKELQTKGHIFKTKSDTETILHLYEDEGVGCLDFLRGMFAFAIWDKNRKRLFIARDRLGIKPLFWGRVGDWVFFGSEMKSLLSLPFVNDNIDWNGFDSFFAYNYIPAPLTIYKDIEKLPPAHYLLVEDGSIKISRYWDLDFSCKLKGAQEEIEEEFLFHLRQSVQMRLMSEVPLGVFLSGGIDSGLIVALMSQLVKEELSSFTIKFDGDTGDFLDESPYANQIAEQYSCNQHTISVKPQVNQALNACCLAFDEPFADDSIIPTYQICKEAKRYVTVILTGLGGDENFGGYERYLGFGLSRYYEMVPSLLHNKLIFPFVQSLKEEAGGNYRINHLKRFVAGKNLSAGRRYQSYITVLGQEQRRSLYADEIAKKIDFDFVDSLGRKHFERLEGGDWLDRALYQDICMYLPDDILALSDRVGMHHSLELRVPFVDHKLMEFCARIPTAMKIKRTEKKYLLKQIGQKLLPESVINHRKQGFCAPINSWLKNDLYNETQFVLNPKKICSGGFFDSRFVQNLLTEHYSRTKLNDKVIFALMVFQKWHLSK